MGLTDEQGLTEVQLLKKEVLLLVSRDPESRVGSLTPEARDIPKATGLEGPSYTVSVLNTEFRWSSTLKTVTTLYGAGELAESSWAALQRRKPYVTSFLRKEALPEVTCDILGSSAT